MTQPLEYQRPTNSSTLRVLAFFAHVIAGYPVLLLASLCGQWLLSWWILGSPPKQPLDDRKYIDGANWIHLVAFLALMALNTLYVVRHRIRGSRLLVRIGVVVALWLGTFLLLRWHPGPLFPQFHFWLD